MFLITYFNFLYKNLTYILSKNIYIYIQKYNMQKNICLHLKIHTKVKITIIFEYRE